jgi:hypothetical protein
MPTHKAIHFLFIDLTSFCVNRESVINPVPFSADVVRFLL